MPRRHVLTDTQLESLIALPRTEPDLIHHWALDEADLAAIARRRGGGNRLGYARCDPVVVRSVFSVVVERMIHELRGRPCLDLERHSPDRKSIMATRSFGRPVALRREMEEAVASHTARAAEKMRRQGLATASLIVFAHTNRHRPDQPQYGGTRPVQLTVATADTGRLTKAAMFGLDCIWRDGFLYKKAGVVFPALTRAREVQGSLFLRPDGDRSEALMASLDLLNRALRPGDRRLRHRDRGPGLDAARRAPVGPLHDAVGRPAGGLTRRPRQGPASSVRHPRHRRHHRGRHPRRLRCRHRG